MMDESIQKEQFSHAFIRAVASAAGCAADRPEVDRDSVDLMLRGYATRLDLQLKCTAREVLHGDEIRLPLKLKNYDDLRPENVLVPRILVVVLVPRDAEEWLEQSEEEMLVRHCAYWRSLRGLPDTENEVSVTLGIPRSQIFDVPALGRLMERISAGERP